MWPCPAKSSSDFKKLQRAYQAPKLYSRVWGTSERSTRIHLGGILLSLTHRLFIKLCPTNTSHILLLRALQTPRRKCLVVLSACLNDDISISEQLLCQKQWGESRGRGSGAVGDMLGHSRDFHKAHLEMSGQWGKLDQTLNAYCTFAWVEISWVVGKRKQPEFGLDLNFWMPTSTKGLIAQH